MSDIRPPDDSLSSYFDELLGEDFNNAAQISLPLAVGDSHSLSGTSNVVSLNSRNKHSGSQDKKMLVLREAAKPLAKPITEYAEPIPSVEELEKKQKLEKLLQTVQEQLLKQEQKIEPQTQTQTVLEIPEEIQDWPIETTAEVAQTIEIIPEVITQVDVKVEQESEDEYHSQTFEVPNVQWAENGLPQWAQGPFDVLLFNVAGLTLAVPLIALGQIYPLTEDLTPLFGQAKWFMGLQPTPTGKIRTINTALFVMPEKYNESLLANTRYVMSLDGVPWGLALDSVNQPMRLHPDQVKWRGDRSKRPWLAGTVKEHMCALLDVPRIAQLMLDADKNHKS